MPAANHNLDWRLLVPLTGQRHSSGQTVGRRLLSSRPRHIIADWMRLISVEPETAAPAVLLIEFSLILVSPLLCLPVTFLVAPTILSEHHHNVHLELGHYLSLSIVILQAFVFNNTCKLRTVLDQSRCRRIPPLQPSTQDDEVRMRKHTMNHPPRC